MAPEGIRKFGLGCVIRLAAAPLLACCGTGDGARDAAGWAGTVRDSAGVRIVENPAATGLPRWTGRIEASVGGDASRPETLFGLVADLDVDAEGRLYVLDPTAGRVSIFAPDGVLAATIGAPGEGPGELSRFAWSLLLRGDTVAIVDWGRGVLHRFRRDGTFLDAPRLPVAGGARSWWRPAAGGYLARSLARYTGEDGRWRGRDHLLRISADLVRIDTVMRFTYAESDLGAPGDPRVPLIVNAPFWAETADGRIAWSTLRRADIRIAGPDGALVARISAPDWTRRPMPESDRDVLVEGLREKIRGLGGDGVAVDRLPIALPDAYPALTGILAPPDGGLWVQRMGSAGDIHPTALNSPDPPTGLGGGEWDMLDAGGRRVGRVSLPARFRIGRIVGDAVYGVQRDGLDRERIVRLRLERAGEIG